MKKKSMLIVAIILMSIGFAAISTTLIINGNANVSENQDDFSVIFTAATLDGKDVYSSVVDDTKKIITFETSELKTLNQTSILNYEVTNNSSNYDAEVKVTCVPKEGTTAKYTSIKNELEGNATIVKAKETLNGTLTVTLDKTSTEEVSEEYTCKLKFNAVERDTIGVTYYYAFGEPTTESTTDYTTLDKNIFARLGSDGSKAICAKGDKMICIKPRDYENSKKALIELYGENNCSYEDPNKTYSNFSCGNDTTSWTINQMGFVRCHDTIFNNTCSKSTLSLDINCS